MIWRPIPSCPGYLINKKGIVRTPTGGYRLGSFGNGYVGATITVAKGPRRFLIHRLLLEAFNGPIPKGMHINHKNSIKSDNRLSNLEMVTPFENIRHYCQARAKWEKTGKPWHKGIKNEERKPHAIRMWEAMGFRATLSKDGGVTVHNAKSVNGKIVRTGPKDVVLGLNQ